MDKLFSVLFIDGAGGVWTHKFNSDQLDQFVQDNQLTQDQIVAMNDGENIAAAGQTRRAIVNAYWPCQAVAVPTGTKLDIG